MDPRRAPQRIGNCGGPSEIRSGVLVSRIKPISLLALMAETNTELVCLLAQSTNGALHLLGTFNNWRSCLRVRLQVR